MAITFFDGFDLYGSASNISRQGWVNSTASLSLVAGRFGGQALRISSANAGVVVQTMSGDDTFAIGVAIRASSLAAHSANGSDVIQFLNGSTVIASLGFTSGGAVRVGRGDYTTNLICGSASGVVANDAWNFYEIEYTRSASVGAVNLYQNGTLIASASGANTGASSIDGIGILSGVDNKDFDDMYFANAATKVGEIKIEVIRPSADTATKDWTRSTGADNFANVDDTTCDDDTTYNSSLTAGQKDLFDLSSLSGSPSSIKAVKPILIARKDDTDARSIRHNMKNGATTTDGTTRSLSTSYAFYSDIYETNPDDAAAFEPADITAMQLGYELVS